ncbi:MAG: DEAD/DEAH box helicase [Bacillota bacterium]|nr:DEAD/DEAH box helicase [Bacillota bacterium]
MSEANFNEYGLSEIILKSILKLGYKKPTQVQQQVIIPALEGKDIIAKSQTGSGKTASFGIPICEKVDIEERNPQALILTPTRELSVQVKEDITNIGRFKRVRCAAVFGKQPFSVQQRELKQRVHVVAGTPGRTLDHIERNSLVVEDIKYLIIDEADKMLNMGFIDQVEAVINKLPKARVTMLFSATMPEQIEKLCSKYMKNPIKIEIAPENITTKSIQQCWYEVQNSDKLDLLTKVLYIENPDSCIIFCRTKENVENLVNQMMKKRYSCYGLHGGMLQKDRLDIMEKFKKGEFRFLVATDIAARGIDIEELTHIINYDIPLENESYVHRIGRTGRAGSKGKAITFVTPNELKFLEEIEEYIQYKIPKAEIPSKDEVNKAKAAFKEKVSVKPKLKSDKGANLNKEITKVYINAGKKKKIRVGDIVGALTNIDGIGADDIGIIDIQDNFSYIDILEGKGKIVLDALQNMKIKGKEVRAQKAAK